jgi:hypothetical protein
MSHTKIEQQRKLNAELRAAEDRRQAASAQVAGILNTVRQSGRTDLTPDEERQVGEARQQRDQARDDIAGIRAKIGELDGRSVTN